MGVAGHAGCRPPFERLVAAVLASTALVACGRVEQVEVTTPAATASPRPAATSTFQGAVSAVDAQAGALVVAVEIVWAPVIEARAQERQVMVVSRTRWDPGPGDLSRLRVGDEVQVDAEDALDGTWRAVRIIVVDLD